MNYSWWYKIQKPRETHKVILKVQFTLISRNELFISMQSLPFSSKQSYLCVPSSLFCFTRKVTSRNLPLVLCFVKSNICWQSVEIRLPYHLGSKYAKWLALIYWSKLMTRQFLSLVVHWKAIWRVSNYFVNFAIDKWSPALQIRTVLLSIQALLSAPNPDDPLANDVAEKWKENEEDAINTGRVFTSISEH